LERAGFWRRAVAAGLDLLVGGFSVVVGSLLAVGILSVAGTSDAVSERLGGIISNVLVLAYTSSEVWLAATPGKLALGLWIGTSAGTRAGRWTLALRWSSKYYSTFLGLIFAMTLDPLTYYLGGFMKLVVAVGCLAALDEHRRAWHDEWAGTAVLRRRAVAAGGPPTVPPPLPVVR
jgi:RDD family protein